MILVYSYYVLDIVHKGHIYYMANAKAIAGENGLSIVGILTDEATMQKKPKPAISFEERFILARAIRYSDMVVTQPEYSPLNNLKRIRPDVLVESSSHEEDPRVAEFMSEIGGRIITLPYYPSQSSTAIKGKIIG